MDIERTFEHSGRKYVDRNGKLFSVVGTNGQMCEVEVKDAHQVTVIDQKIKTFDGQIVYNINDNLYEEIDSDWAIKAEYFYLTDIPIEGSTDPHYVTAVNGVIIYANTAAAETYTSKSPETRTRDKVPIFYYVVSPDKGIAIINDQLQDLYIESHTSFDWKCMNHVQKVVPNESDSSEHCLGTLWEDHSCQWQ